MNKYYQTGLMVRTTPAFQKYRTGALGGATGIADSGIGANIPKEVDSIDAEMKSLNTQLFNQLPTTTEDPKFRFYSSIWRPFAEEWQNTAQALTARTIVNLARSQSLLLQRGAFKDLQEYRARLQQMWNSAEESGFNLQGPEPTPPRRDPGEQVSDFFGKLMKLLKTMMYVVVIGGAVWLGFIVFQGLRHG